jgi:hypothetical protein
VEVGGNQQRVVVEHLLEVRDGPRAVDRVPREPATHLVVDAAGVHRLERHQAHARLAAREQELDRRRGGELRPGRRAPAAPLVVELPAQADLGAVEQAGVDRLLGRAQQRAAAQALGHPLALLADLVALGAPRVVDGEQDLLPARHAVARLGREVRAAVERDLVGRDEDVERPAAVPGHRLNGLHVERVDVGALLAIDLHADEALVHDGRGRLVLERLTLHHVAPVAGAVADRDEQRLVLVPGSLQGFFAPREPVDGVVLVLEEVGAGFLCESVHAPVSVGGVGWSRARSSAE